MHHGPLLTLCHAIFLLAHQPCLGYDEAPWQPIYDYYHIDLGYSGGHHGGPQIKVPEPRDVMVDVINDLGVKLLAIHNEHNDNNIGISPYGALSMLAALTEGVQGDAAKEIIYSAHIPKDKQVVRIGLRDIHRHLKSYFIPQEGFLAGLTLNLNNVTLRGDYADILRFYGFDYESFNNALYPGPSTMPIPSDGNATLGTTLGMPEMTTEESHTTSKPVFTENKLGFPMNSTTTEEISTVLPVEITVKEKLTPPPFVTTPQNTDTTSGAPTTTTPISTTVLINTDQTSTQTSSTTVTKDVMTTSTKNPNSKVSEISTTTYLTTPTSITDQPASTATTIQSIATTTTSKPIPDSTTVGLTSTTIAVQPIPTTTTVQSTSSITTVPPTPTNTTDQPTLTTTTGSSIPTTVTDMSTITTVQPIPTSTSITTTTDQPTTIQPMVTTTTVQPIPTTTVPSTSTITTLQPKTESPETTSFTQSSEITTQSEIPTTVTTLAPITTTKLFITTTELPTTTNIITSTIPPTTVSTTQTTILIPETTTVLLTTKKITSDIMDTTQEVITQAVTKDQITVVPESTVTMSSSETSQTTTSEIIPVTVSQTTTSTSITTEESISTTNGPETTPPGEFQQLQEFETTTPFFFGTTPQFQDMNAFGQNNFDFNYNYDSNSQFNNNGTSTQGGSIYDESSYPLNLEDQTNSGFNSNVRRSRSVTDYILQRFHGHHINNYNKRPFRPYYVPQQPLTFMVYGKHPESGIHFMKYDTVLPFFFAANLNTLALSFPLDNSKYYLLLLLPVDYNGVDQLVCDLRLHGNFKFILENLRLTHVIATIPSFTLKGYVTLTPSLQQLGVRRIFEPRQADFSPMTNATDIYVTNIEQAVTVTIQNYLDSAAAQNYKNFRRHLPVYFKADHPFLYFVMDTELNVALMVGKVVNPLNSRIR